MTDRNHQGDALLSPGAEGGGAGSEEGGGGGSGSGEMPSQDLSKNWFSAENTLRVYGEVRALRRLDLHKWLERGGERD